MTKDGSDCETDIELAGDGDVRPLTMGAGLGVGLRSERIEDDDPDTDSLLRLL